MSERRFLSSLLLAAVIISAPLGAGVAWSGDPNGAAASPLRTHPCPRQFPTGSPPRNAWRPALHSLAPPGPAAVRLCRYSERSERLVREASPNAGQVKQLVRAFDALRPLPQGQKDGFTSCPFYVDPIIEAHLAYPHHHAVTVRVQMRCTRATNGDIDRSWPPAALRRLRRTLLHLTRQTNPIGGSR